MSNAFTVTTDHAKRVIYVTVTRPLTADEAWQLGMNLRLESLALKETHARSSATWNAPKAKEIFVGLDGTTTVGEELVIRTEDAPDNLFDF